MPNHFLSIMYAIFNIYLCLSNNMKFASIQLHSMPYISNYLSEPFRRILGGWFLNSANERSRVKLLHFTEFMPAVSDFGRGLPCENSWKTLLVAKTRESDVNDQSPSCMTARKRWYAVHVRWIRQFCVMESLRRAPIIFDITKLSFLWDQKLKFSKPCIGFS